MGTGERGELGGTGELGRAGGIGEGWGNWGELGDSENCAKGICGRGGVSGRSAENSFVNFL